jgi:diguanylate cyclase (GGDEF)-like protein
VGSGRAEYRSVSDQRRSTRSSSVVSSSHCTKYYLSAVVTARLPMGGIAILMQRASLEARAVPRIFDRLVKLRPAQAWLLILFSADIAVLADLLAGPDTWLGPLYLLVICVAAWSLGWKAGQATGVACMGLTFALNGLSLYPYGTVDFAWNLGVRFGAISIVIAVIAGARRAYVREWWLARTDPLTGALNRQAFFELAQTAIDPRRWHLLIYADLDGFKKINDNRGHMAGDACLRAFGNTVRRTVRCGDIFARLGGDEFVILMSVRDEKAAGIAAARLHDAMNNIPTMSGHLRCSVGGLSIPPGAAKVDDLLRGADDLMYRAKLRGGSVELGVAPKGDDPLREGLVSRGVKGRIRNSAIVNDRRAYSETFLHPAVPR